MFINRAVMKPYHPVYALKTILQTHLVQNPHTRRNIWRDFNLERSCENLHLTNRSITLLGDCLRTKGERYKTQLLEEPNSTFNEVTQKKLLVRMFLP